MSRQEKEFPNGTTKFVRVAFDVVLANGTPISRQCITIPKFWLEGRQEEHKAYLDTAIKDYLRHISYEVRDIQEDYYE